MICYFNLSSVLHSGFLDPLNHTDNKEYWSGPYMNDLLNFMGIAQNSVVRNSLENEDFYDWQIGSQEDMTPGLVDVSLVDQIYLITFIILLSHSLEEHLCSRHLDTKWLKRIQNMPHPIFTRLIMPPKRVSSIFSSLDFKHHT